MSEREYEVVEPMVAANIFHVRARNRQEAIEKVLRNEHEYVEMADATPKCSLRISDAHLIRKAKRP